MKAMVEQLEWYENTFSAGLTNSDTSDGRVNPYDKIPPELFARYSTFALLKKRVGDTWSQRMGVEGTATLPYILDGVLGHVSYCKGPWEPDWTYYIDWHAREIRVNYDDIFGGLCSVALEEGESSRLQT